MSALFFRRGNQADGEKERQGRRFPDSQSRLWKVSCTSRMGWLDLGPLWRYFFRGGARVNISMFGLEAELPQKCY